jgi:predicted transcriptional regulator
MDKGMLELSTRKKIYEIIKNNPGLHLREISRQSGLLPSLVEYHLRHLIKNDFIYVVKEQNYSRFFCKESEEKNKSTSNLSNRQKKILHFLREDISLSIILFILRKKSVTHKHIRNELNKSGSTLSYHLNKLVEAEILIRNHTGNEKGYRLKDREEVIKTMIMCGIKLPNQVDGFISTWDDFL